jgi:hypothetical protein
MPSMSMIEALYPLYWLKLAGGLLNKLAQAAPLEHRPMTSVLDHIPDLLESSPASKSSPSAPVHLHTQSTGWGPMP